MFKNATYSFILFFIALFSLSAITYSQVSNTVMGIKSNEAKESQDYTISLQLYQSEQPSKILIYYRSFGESEYKVGDVSLQGSTAEFTIPAEKVVPPSLECYFIITLQNGIETYPIGAPSQAQPLQVRVLPKSPKDKEIIILSPESSKNVGESDFFVSISLLRASSDVDKTATKVYIDNTDVSAKVLFAEDMLLLNPENFPEKFSTGLHTIKVELYTNKKELYHTALTSFNLVSDETAANVASGFTYSGNVLTEGRNEHINNVNTWYNNASVDLNGSYKSWEVSSRVYVTSEEKKYLQPNNRFSLDVRSDWLLVSAGDHNPNYPSLVLSGKRLRGVTGAITLGFFNVISSYGEMIRPIEGSYPDVFYPNRSSAPLSGNIIDVDSLKYGAPKAQVNSLGTYSRNIFAVHPYFGKGENFQFGLTYLHSSDDPKSIDFGARPQENLVVGSDIFFAFDKQRIQVNGEAALSIMNSDISSGTLSDADLDTIFKAMNISNVDNIKKYKNTASKFITINQFLKPLNPQKLSTLATEGSVSLNYFGNFLKGNYIYRGGDYTSFANSYLRTNIAGYNFLDRLRLLENRLFLSVSYEKLKDNLQKTTPGTNTYNNLSASVSLYPRNDLPSFLISYLKSDNSNDLTDSAHIGDKSFRVLTQVSYDFEYIKKHSVSLGFSLGERDDKSFNNFDADNYSINLSSSTTWDNKLQTSFNIIQNYSSISKKPNPEKLSYTSIVLGGKYFMLDNKLTLNGSINPSFGDFKRVSFDANAQYMVLKNLSLQFVFRYLINSKIPGFDSYNDSVTGLNARFTW